MVIVTFTSWGPLKVSVKLTYKKFASALLLRTNRIFKCVLIRAFRCALIFITSKKQVEEGERNEFSNLNASPDLMDLFVN